MRRVVVTGMGMVTPLGCGVESHLARLIAGKSGARRIDRFQGRRPACQIACLVPRGPTAASGTFDPDDR